MYLLTLAYRLHKNIRVRKRVGAKECQCKNEIWHAPLGAIIRENIDEVLRK